MVGEYLNAYFIVNQTNLRKFILTTEFKTIHKFITREMIFFTKLNENFVQCEETTGTHE